ncbi:MAG: hypothetical protein NT039_00860 [Candidatus Berkelbacteria bacterium]|nr:hypothetical protein [Candidatus Berkelbacteria bacterium]
MESETDLYNFEKLTTEADGYRQKAGEFAVEYNLSFSEAMELALAEGEAIELIGEEGTEKVVLAPLAALIPLTQSANNEALQRAIRELAHDRQGIYEIITEKDPNPTRYSAGKIEHLTDFEDIGRFIGEWVVSNQQELDRLEIQDWRQLTPVQSALLSSRIVSTSLRFDYLAGGNRDLVPEGLRTLDEEQFSQAKKTREDHLDGLGIHQLLREGHGVCRHYGLATEFVFRALKSKQEGDRLAGTEVVCVNSMNLELDTSNHSYNLILVPEGDNLRVGVFDSLHVNSHPENLNQWRQETDKFYTRTAATITNLALWMIVDIITEEGEDRLRQWFEKNRDDSARLLNTLFLTMALPSKFGTDAFIDFIEEVKEDVRPNERLVLELFKLRRAKYLRNCIHRDEALKHLRAPGRKVIKPINDETKNDIETRLDEQSYNPELMAREKATRTLPLSDFYALGEEMDEDDIRYDIEQGLGFVYYRTIITLSQAMLPFLPSARQEVGSEMVKRSMEKSKIKFLKAQSVFADELVNLADDGQLGTTYLQQLAEVVGADDFVEVIEQGANSFSPIFATFQFSEEERETIQANLSKSGEALARIKTRWPGLKKIILESSSS